MTPELPQANQVPTPPAQPEQSLLTPPPVPKRWLTWIVGGCILVMLVITGVALVVGLSDQPDKEKTDSSTSNPSDTRLQGYDISLAPLAERLLGANPIALSSEKDLPTDIAAVIGNEDNSILDFRTHEAYAWDLAWKNSDFSTGNGDNIFYYGGSFGRPNSPMSQDRTIAVNEWFVDSTGMTWEVKSIDPATKSVRLRISGVRYDGYDVRTGQHSIFTLKAGEIVPGAKHRIDEITPDHIVLSEDPLQKIILLGNVTLDISPVHEEVPYFVVEVAGKRVSFAPQSYATLVSDIQLPPETKVYRVSGKDDETFVVPLSETIVLIFRRKIFNDKPSDYGITIFVRPVAPSGNNSLAPTPTVPEVIQVSNVMSPKETYVKLNAELGSIKTYADFEAILLKYGSKEKIADSLEEISEIPEAQRNWVVPEVKAELLSSQEIATIQESVNGSTATLKIITKYGPLTITLVLENNQWKLDDERGS